MENLLNQNLMLIPQGYSWSTALMVSPFLMENKSFCRPFSVSLLDRWDINALIDINKRGNSAERLPEDISLDKDAQPLCKVGLHMCSWGYVKNKEVPFLGDAGFGH